MTKRLTLAIDIDEVLAQHNAGLAKYHNAHFDTTHTAQDYFSDQWSQVWNISSEEVEARIKGFFTPEVFAAFEPVPQAFESLQRLKEQTRLVVITVRRASVVEATKEWLALHYPHTFDEVHFALNRWEPLPGARNKGELSRTLGIDYLIDDSLHNVADAATHGIPAILFGNYTWNQCQKLPSGVTRSSTWPEVVRFLQNHSA